MDSTLEVTGGIRLHRSVEVARQRDLERATPRWPREITHVVDHDAAHGARHVSDEAHAMGNCRRGSRPQMSRYASWTASWCSRTSRHVGEVDARRRDEARRRVRKTRRRVARLPFRFGGAQEVRKAAVGLCVGGKLSFFSPIPRRARTWGRNFARSAADGSFSPPGRRAIRTCPRARRTVGAQRRRRGRARHCPAESLIR